MKEIERLRNEVFEIQEEMVTTKRFVKIKLLISEVTRTTARYLGVAALGGAIGVAAGIIVNVIGNYLIRKKFG